MEFDQKENQKVSPTTFNDNKNNLQLREEFKVPPN